MSRVAITELLAEAVATAANANATLTSWNSTSADVDETNVREHGLDRRTLAARAFTPTDGRPTPIRLAGSTANASAGTPTLVVVSAANAEIGPINFDLTNSDQLVVRCSFDYNLSGAIGTGNTAVFYLGYATASGGPYTTITATRRRGRLATTASGVMGIVVRESAPCTIVHRFTAISSTTLWLGLLQDTSAGNVNIANLQMGARLHAR